MLFWTLLKKLYHEHCNIDRSRRSLLIDFIGLNVCAISIATSGICITVTKAIHWAFELYARRTWDQIDVRTGSNVDGIFQRIETVFYLTIDTWREVLLNILNLDFNHDETNMSKRPLTLVQCFHFFYLFHNVTVESCFFWTRLHHKCPRFVTRRSAWYFHR